MNTAHAPRAPEQELLHGEPASASLQTSGLAGMQSTWGNQVMLALIQAGEALVPCYQPMRGALAQEGVSALLDPMGAMARAQARDVLAERLTVREDGAAPSGSPAELSLEEFERMVALYAAIQRGRCDLSLDANALPWTEQDEFEAGAMNDIASIMQTECGRKLLTELAYGSEGHQTTISPQEAEDKGPLASLKNDWDPLDAPDVSIRYTPARTTHISKLAWGESRSDVTLYHELTHAWYDATNATDMGPISWPTTVPRDIDWFKPLPRAEHQATGLDLWADAEFSENAYRTERAEMAGSPLALPGDAGMPRRDSYSG